MEELELLSRYFIVARSIVVLMWNEEYSEQLLRKLEELRVLKSQHAVLCQSEPSLLYVLLSRIVLHQEYDLVEEAIQTYDNAVASHLGCRFEGSLRDDLRAEGCTRLTFSQ
ncbi:MAG: hypothetical protein Q8Q18_00625 [bacterium]|nr:hypothetical protein [bacterium]